MNEMKLEGKQIGCQYFGNYITSSFCYTSSYGLKAHEATSGILVLFITSNFDMKSEHNFDWDV